MFGARVGKVLQHLGRITGRRATLPGKVALRLDPELVTEFELPPIVIAITGSSGKTAIGKLLTEATRMLGLEVVSNCEGNNQLAGIATTLLRASDRHQSVAGDVAVLECSERACGEIFPMIRPTHILVTNIFRHQLARNGHPQYLAERLKAALDAYPAALIVNGDDPLVTYATTAQQPITRYSVTAPALRESERFGHIALDNVCPNCEELLTYEWRTQGHLGAFACPGCGLRRGTPDHTLTAVSDGQFVLDGDGRIAPTATNIKFAYNVLAAFTTLTTVFDFPDAEVIAALEDATATQLVERVQQFRLDTDKGTYLPCKHSSPMAYNTSLRLALEHATEPISVVLILDPPLPRFVPKETTWLWDVDFELLNDALVRHVYVGGRHADALGVRLLSGGLNPDRVSVIPDLDRLLTTLSAHRLGRTFLLTSPSDAPKFFERLPKGALQ